jgi:biopolymer transport protein ExbD
LNDKLIVPADLESRIQQETAGVPDPTIVLRMDAELTIQDLVDILATGTKLKVRVVMATQAMN